MACLGGNAQARSPRPLNTSAEPQMPCSRDVGKHVRLGSAAVPAGASEGPMSR